MSTREVDGSARASTTSDACRPYRPSRTTGSGRAPRLSLTRRRRSAARRSRRRERSRRRSGGWCAVARHRLTRAQAAPSTAAISTSASASRWGHVRPVASSPDNRRSPPVGSSPRAPHRSAGGDVEPGDGHREDHSDRGTAGSTVSRTPDVAASPTRSRDVPVRPSRTRRAPLPRPSCVSGSAGMPASHRSIT